MKPYVDCQMRCAYGPMVPARARQPLAGRCRFGGAFSRILWLGLRSATDFTARSNRSHASGCNSISSRRGMGFWLSWPGYNDDGAGFAPGPIFRYPAKRKVAQDGDLCSSIVALICFLPPSWVAA